MLLILLLTSITLAGNSCQKLIVPTWDVQQKHFEYYGSRITGSFRFLVTPDYQLEIFAGSTGLEEADNNRIVFDDGKIVSFTTADQDSLLKALAKISN